MTDTRALSGAFLDDLRERLTDALGAAWGPACVDRAVEAVAPVLQHAEDAARGSHEGIRLWMIDCSRIAAKHRERADAAEQTVSEMTDCLRKLGLTP